MILAVESMPYFCARVVVVVHERPASLSFLLWYAILILRLPLYACTLKPSLFPKQVGQLFMYVNSILQYRTIINFQKSVCQIVPLSIESQIEVLEFLDKIDHSFRNSQYTKRNKIRSLYLLCGFNVVSRHTRKRGYTHAHI